MVTKKSFLTFMYIISILMISYDIADAKRTTRDLMFEENINPATFNQENTKDKTVWVSVKTAVELQRNGKIATVLPNFKFQSGDRVKFIYTVNTDCYVYWILKGTSEKLFMLFPDPRTGSNNLVKRNEVCTIPTKGSFVFDDNPGKEKLLVFLCKERIPVLEQARMDAAESNGNIGNNTSKIVEISQNSNNKRQSRDLVFDEHENTSSGIKTSSQASSTTSEPLFVYYELSHN